MAGNYYNRTYCYVQFTNKQVYLIGENEHSYSCSGADDSYVWCGDKKYLSFDACGMDAELGWNKPEDFLTKWTSDDLINIMKGVETPDTKRLMSQFDKCFAKVNCNIERFIVSKEDDAYGMMADRAFGPEVYEITASGITKLPESTELNEMCNTDKPYHEYVIYEIYDDKYINVDILAEFVSESVLTPDEIEEVIRNNYRHDDDLHLKEFRVVVNFVDVNIADKNYYKAKYIKADIPKVYVINC